MMARLLACCLLCAALAAKAGSLEEDFRTPPPCSRIQVFWHLQYEAMTKASLTLELEQMAAQGIGGGWILVMYPCPQYGTPEWLPLMRHIHEESKRLHLTWALHNCPGWSEAGGAWVPVEDSMKEVVVQRELVQSDGQRIVKVGPPPGKKYYRSTGALAYPVTGSWLEARKFNNGNRGELHLKEKVDLAPALKPNGGLEWQAPAGNWAVYVFGYADTGALTGPNCEGDDAQKAGLRGLEVDKMDASAVARHFEHYAGKVAGALGKIEGGEGITAVALGSWTGGEQTWCADFAAEFEKRMGYDLRPWLPLIQGDLVEDIPSSERVMRDYRRVIADLIAERYYGTISRSAKERGLAVFAEAYACGRMTAVDARKNLPFVDVPTCEYPRLTEGRETRREFGATEAISMAHIHGKPVVAGEAFTGRTTYAEPLRAMKERMDDAFQRGINRLILHSACLQPGASDYFGPGNLLLGKSGEENLPESGLRGDGPPFNRNNVWWPHLKGPALYAARCQSLLQKGVHVADVLCYTGEEAVEYERDDVGATCGYRADGIDTDALTTRLSVKDGELVLPDGGRYRVLCLPYEHGENQLTPQTLKRLRDLLADGATIMGNKRRYSPSYAGFPKGDQEVAALSDEIWGASPSQEAAQKIGKGTLFCQTPYILKEMGVPMDVDAPGVSFIHRKVQGTDIYFVVYDGPRTGPTSDAGPMTCFFRVKGKRPELWYPDTGRMLRAGAFYEAPTGTWMHLMLRPKGSVFVVFREAAPPQHAIYVQLPRSAETSPVLPEISSDAAGRVSVAAAANGDYTFTLSDETTAVVRVVGMPAPMAIGGPWKVEFPPNHGAPPAVTLEQLIPLNTHPDNGVKYFSGIAAYQTSFQLPAGSTGDGGRLVLDLGTVEQSARVLVNGHEAGILWKPPYQTEITAQAVDGENTLRVEVANTWLNRIIGDAQLPEGRRVARVSAGGRPFQDIVERTTGGDANAALQPSGLLGPVRLHFMRTFTSDGGGHP